MRVVWLAAVLSGVAAVACAQTRSLDDRPLVTAQGVGEVTRTPDWLRVGFTLRGEGTTPVEALASMTKQRSVALASIRALKGLSDAEITDGSIATQEVRKPACSPSQPYLTQQRLSVDECAVVGAIVTVEMDVRVRPAARAGDVASLAAQIGGKNVGLRGSGFDYDSDVQAEAAQKAVADARRQADLIARAAGGKLGELLRVQDVGATGYPLVIAGYSQPLPLPPPPAPVPEARVVQQVPFNITPQPLTRTARVTVVYALSPP